MGTRGAVATELDRASSERGAAVAGIEAKGLSTEVWGRRKSRAVIEPRGEERFAEVLGELGSTTPGDRSPKGRIFTWYK